jgi:hypothetical protein
MLTGIYQLLLNAAWPKLSILVKKLIHAAGYRKISVYAYQIH